MILSFEIIFSSLVFICMFWYTLNGILFYFGLNRSYKQIQNTPRVSVLVSARNEEHDLPRCLNSLVTIAYPKHLYEVLVLNDRSTDKTLEIARNFARQNNNVHVLDIASEQYGLKGKMNALAQGLEKATGEIILITDADCIVSQSWITQFVSYFMPDTGMVGGLTLPEGSGLLAKLQSLDWLFLQSIAAGTAGIGKPVTILGNNFAFRKAAYEKLGGFASIGFSLTEDMVLMRAMKDQTDYKIIYPLEAGHMVRTKAERAIADVYDQKLRWLSGSKKSSLWGYYIMISAFMGKLAIVLSILLNMITWLSVAGFILMICIEFLLLLKILRRVNKKGVIRVWPVFQIYYIAYTLLFGIVFWIPMKVRWKKRIYPFHS